MILYMLIIVTRGERVKSAAVSTDDPCLSFGNDVSGDVSLEVRGGMEKLLAWCRHCSFASHRGIQEGPSHWKLDRMKRWGNGWRQR